MRPFVPLDPSVDIFAEPRDTGVTPARTAQVAGAFADPFGLIDIFGQYPAFPEEEATLVDMLSGPRSPSLLENIREGELVDAGFQLAGAIPIAGPAVKAARTGRKLSKRENIEALKERYIAEHPPIGSYDAATQKPVTERLINTRANAYAKKIEEGPPAVYRREMLRDSGGLDIPRIPERTIIHPEELQGRALSPIVGDRAIRALEGEAGITSIRGVPLSEELIPQGGPTYTLDQQGTGRGWASMYGAADKKQRGIQRAAEESGLPTLGVYSAMGRDAIAFSHMPILAIVRQIEAIGIPKDQIKAFNRAVRNARGKTPGRPEFVGLDSPDLEDQLLGLGDFGREGAGALRLRIIDEFKQKRWENQGFPVYDDVIQALTETELAYTPRGSSGYTIFRADPDAAIMKEPTHLSYDTAIPALRGEEYMGGLIKSVPPEVMFPKTMRELSQRLDKTGKPLSREDQLGSLAFDPNLYEVADQEYIDQLIKYMNKNLGTDYAEGGAVTG
mgnify:FL=1